MRRALVVTLVLLAIPLAAAQGHAHEEGEGVAAVLHDGPDDGRAVVGAFTHFGFALLKDGVPQVHRDASFRVVHNGQVLFETPDAHEYDGLFSFDVAFPSPGPYEVIAESEGMAVGRFAGTVVAPANETVAQVLFEAHAPEFPLARGFDGTVSVVDPAGNLLPHTDVVLEVREAPSGRLVTRTHAHIHDAPVTFSQYVPAPGEYELTVVAYKAFQTGRSVDVRPVVGTFPLDLAALPAGAHTPSPTALLAAQPLAPRGTSAESGGFALHGTYDPQPLVGVGNTARLAAVLVDANRTPVAHADFGFRLEGPDGLVFASDALHEYDGAFEFAFTPTTPGVYEATLVARHGDVELPIDYQVQVLPPAAPLDPGSFAVSVEGLDGARAGTPVELTFSVAGPTGPLAHSEVDVTIHRDGEAPIYQFKLHTHDSGTTRALVVFPQEGAWRVAVDPIPLMPQASLVERAVFEATVGAGAVPEPAAPLGVGGERNPVPAPGWLALAALALGLALARRTK